MLDDLLPERVELRQAERPGSAEAGNRSGPDQHDPGAPFEHPLELLDGPLDDGQRDHRGREDPALVVELPRLVDPLVQGVDDRVDGLGIVAQPLLDQAGQGGEHDRPVDPLLVHQLHPGARLAEGGDRAHGLTEDLPAALSLGVALAEVVLLGAGSGHHLEGRVRDVLADLAAHDDLGATPHLHVVDHPAVAVGEELGQRVARLVEVVVGIENGDVEDSRRHRPLLR